MNEKYVPYIAIGVAALIIVLFSAWLGSRSYRKRKARKARLARQYREAEAFTRQVIEQQIEYANALHTIDDLTIKAFEVMVEEMARQCDRPSFMK